MGHYTRSLLIASGVLIALTTAVPVGTDFKIVERTMDGGNLHKHYILPYGYPMADGKMLDFVRQRFPYTPGDYFLWPIGADTTTLSDKEHSEIKEQLKDNIRPSLYDDFVLQRLDGYQYTIDGGSIHRREYYVSYARGDTIYVISGWLGKFLAFYRAIPGDFRYDLGQLQGEVQKLSLSYRKAKEDSFKRIDEKKNYFLEYVDRKNMMRVRNYLVDATFIIDDSRQPAMTTYNLIEITKFIDPEVMP